MVPERELVFSSKFLSEVKLPSAGEIVPDSELLYRLRNVRAPRMRGMVPEREFDPSCVRFVETTRADGSVPERKLRAIDRNVSCPASEGKVPDNALPESSRYVSDVKLKRARGMVPVNFTSPML